jgi:hypothetical protein
VKRTQELNSAEERSRKEKKAVTEKIINTATTIEYIRVRDLSADPAYQRELNSKRAEAIGENLDTSRIGVLVASRRNGGTVVVVDGQHRHHALMHAGRGDELVRCEIHHGLTRKDEAALFLKLNGGRKPIGAIDEYKAALEAGVPWAMEVHTIASGLNLKIQAGGSRRTIQAVLAVKSVHLRQKNLKRTLAVLAKWDDSAVTFNGELMKSVSIFIAHYEMREDSPGVDDGHLVRALMNQEPESVLAAIKRRVDGRIIKLPEAGCSVLLELYNKRLGKNSRLPPYMRGVIGVRGVQAQDAAE